MEKAQVMKQFFPTVCKKLHEITGIKYDKELVAKFLPYASYLNNDETKDVAKAWVQIAKTINIDTENLKKTILPLAALYSIAEHTRTLLIALTDGVLPSNTGGGYNLRVLLRRALSFTDNYKWDVSLSEIASWHASYLKPLFPELAENVDDVLPILENEKKKYKESRKRNARIVTDILQKETTIGKEKLIELYDSEGICPEEIQKSANMQGKNINVPDNFYALVAERHEQKNQKSQAKEQINIDETLSETKALFYQDYEVTEGKSKVLFIEKNQVIVDETVFFATSGGQIHDKGTMSESVVKEVYRQGKYIIHILESAPSFKVGDMVVCKADKERRKQLSQHHTITHIYNQLIRRKLGKHAWQAGTAKFPEKARLDMTHFDSLNSQQIKELEQEANEVIKKDLVVESRFEPRTEAEIKYGFAMYQGGVVPGKNIRIVDIKGFDIEACGGTHVHSTAEIGTTKILKTSKIQDGIVRIEYVAGKAADKERQGEDTIIEELAILLHCSPNQTPGRIKELFTMWKQVVKKNKKIADYTLKSQEKTEQDILQACATVIKTQPEHVLSTAKRFLKELKNP